ncbi:uncharacterized protein LOC143544872 [Bidens hawaiensis]|uniref:uncharacterized protein LOC143544872 n=1 Tax=Bidens hawaiensis TaxID=980011 RepID=UPI00404B2CC3
MTGVKESFTQLDESFTEEVNLGDKKKLMVEGKGTVRINLANGSRGLLEDVYYIPRLKYNLLSVGQLMKKGYAIMFDEGKCVIKNKQTGVELMHIKVAKNNMFIVDASKVIYQQNPSHDGRHADSHLWHLSRQWKHGDKSKDLGFDVAWEDPFPLSFLEEPHVIDNDTSMGEGQTSSSIPSNTNYESGEGLSDEEAHFLALSISDPTTFCEAAKKPEWQNAMDNELAAIEKHDTWELVSLPSGKNVVGLKWLIRQKLEHTGRS